MGLDALILRRVNSGEQGDKCLELKNKKSKRIEFLWSLPSVEWWARVNLTDGFTDAPGHHYLTDEDIDDAIVLLQFKESAASYSISDILRFYQRSQKGLDCCRRLFGI
jgi:hypothetical protein